MSEEHRTGISRRRWRAVKIDNQSRTHKKPEVFWLQIKIVAIHISLWRGWVIDAQRCCHDRLAGGRKTLRQNDWLLLFDVSVWLTCDGWLHLQNRSALTVVMTPNISSVISEQRSDNFQWKEYTSRTKLHAIFLYISIRREVINLHLSQALSLM